ncbi:NAD-dependent epimerase/dehydratase family protein [Rhodococcus aerolatus]
MSSPTTPLRRVLVTGASGNVGTAVLRRLTAAPQPPEVLGVVRRPPPAVPPYDTATFHALDLAEPDAAERLVPLLAGVDAVVHLAWGFQPTRDEAYLERTGVGGTRAVLAAVREAGVPHLVHMSSVGAYSPATDRTPVTEDFPHGGMPTSQYSRHKAAAEALLDDAEGTDGAPVITRLRPGVVLQGDAASGLVRYFLPGYLPTAVLRLLPVLPADRALLVPVVHSTDVADAVVRALGDPVGGAFNLAADPPLTRDDFATALGARGVHLPAPVLSRLVGLSWRARLQALEPGWVDLAFSVPQLDTTRAREVLGWSPAVAPLDALREVVDAAVAGRSTPSPPLRPRTGVDLLRRALRSGPIGNRRRT